MADQARHEKVIGHAGPAIQGNPTVTVTVRRETPLQPEVSRRRPETLRSSSHLVGDACHLHGAESVPGSHVVSAVSTAAEAAESVGFEDADPAAAERYQPERCVLLEHFGCHLAGGAGQRCDLLVGEPDLDAAPHVGTGHTGEDMDVERAAANPDDRVWCMSEVDIFCDLDEGEMEAMAAAASMRTYAAGELIHSPHQPLEALFILKKGRIRIFRASPEGRALTTAVIEPGTGRRPGHLRPSGAARRGVRRRPVRQPGDSSPGAARQDVGPQEPDR